MWGHGSGFYSTLRLWFTVELRFSAKSRFGPGMPPNIQANILAIFLGGCGKLGKFLCSENICRLVAP